MMKPDWTSRAPLSKMYTEFLPLANGQEQGELQSKTHLSFDIAHSPTPGYSPAQAENEKWASAKVNK